MQVRNVEAIVFDLGGVLIDVDYDKTIEAFKLLGASNAKEVYTQAAQKAYVDAFERGQISRQKFINLLRQDMAGLHKQTTDTQVESAWNAMLGVFQPNKLDLVQEFRGQGYRTFLFPNIDEIHYSGVIEACQRDGVLEKFSQAFDGRYFSHVFKYNKPYAESFKQLALDIKGKYNIDAGKILFIDDSKKHIYGPDGNPNEGAIAAGLHGMCVPSNLSTAELRKALVGEIKKINSTEQVNTNFLLHTH